MARFLLTVWPFPGHVHPFVSVGAALRARGHSVAFYSGRGARPVLEREGFHLLPFRHIDEERLWARLEAAEVRAQSNWRAPGLLLRAFRDWLAGTVADQVADLLEVVPAWRPDALVTETFMWGPSAVLSDLLPAPVGILSTLLGCLLPGRNAPPWGPGLPPPRTLPTRLLARSLAGLAYLGGHPLRRRLDQVRAAHYLPPLGCSLNALGARVPLYLIPSIPALDYQRRDLPPTVHYVGPCIWNKPAHASPPPWLATLPADRPWVHVTEGTAHHHDPFLLRAALQGLAGLPLQVVLTTGPQRDPDALGLGPGAPNVRVVQWVSHSDLLPRCAVVVTTGGAGTVLAALQAGVPLVVVPTHWDKPDNAQRVVAAGAGVRLAPRRCTPEGLRAAVQRVLSEPRFRVNAQRLAALLAAAPGPHGAARLLEGLVRPAEAHATPSAEARAPVPVAPREIAAGGLG